MWPPPPTALGLGIPPAWLLQPKVLLSETWRLNPRTMGTATAFTFSRSASTEAKHVSHTDTHCLTHCTSINSPIPLGWPRQQAPGAGTHTSSRFFKTGYQWLANFNEEDALTLHRYLPINNLFGPTHLSTWSYKSIHINQVNVITLLNSLCEKKNQVKSLFLPYWTEICVFKHITTLKMPSTKCYRLPLFTSSMFRFLCRFLNKTPKKNVKYIKMLKTQTQVTRILLTWPCFQWPLNVVAEQNWPEFGVFMVWRMQIHYWNDI